MDWIVELRRRDGWYPLPHVYASQAEAERVRDRKRVPERYRVRGVPKVDSDTIATFVLKP